jgi:hypothetical protein
VFPCIVEQHLSRDVANQTQAHGEEGDEYQIKFKQFHS